VPEGAATPRTGVPEGAGTPRPPVPEGAATPRAGAPRSGSRVGGIAGRVGGAIALEALNIAALLSAVVFELIVVPWLERLQRRLEESYRRTLEREIQRYYQQYLQRDVDRAVYCGLSRVRALEAQGRTPYANMTIKVIFRDTSPRIDQLFRRGPPQSIFDLSFHHLTFISGTISDTQVATSSGTLTESPDDDLLTGDDLYEQTVTFGFRTPSSAEIAAQYGQGTPPPSCDCFIATACYGSPFAPEVRLLRRFRDRVLLRSLPGRWLVRAYYAVSPRYAAWLRSRPRMQRLVRTLLIAPVVTLVRWMGVDDQLPRLNLTVADGDHTPRRRRYR
jgi:hypothetical protein